MNEYQAKQAKTIIKRVKSDLKLLNHILLFDKKKVAKPKSIINSMDFVIDGQLPMMMEKPDKLKVLSMSSVAFKMYNDQLKRMLPSIIEDVFSYRGIDIDVFEANQICISIAMKQDQ